MLAVTDNTLWATGGIFALLALASTVVIVLTLAWPRDWSELTSRVRSWWVMAAVFAGALVIDPRLSILVMAAISFLALREYLSMIETRRGDRWALLVGYLSIPLQYGWIALGWRDVSLFFVPVIATSAMLWLMVAGGRPGGIVAAGASLVWGLMLIVFNLSHAALLLALPATVNPAGGGAGLLLFLVTAAQFNDVAQYVVGKALGRRAILPGISPGKTWEGFLGGLTATVALAMLAAPFLTPLTLWQSAAAGLIIAIGGFAGDVTISAIKRDAGVKDSGTLIPGHGGVLDRTDSLLFSAPMFFYLLYFAHYAP